MALISEMKNRESGKHWRAKQLLAEFIADGKCVITDGKHTIDFADVGWQYMILEGLTVNWEDDYVDAPYDGHCNYICGEQDGVLFDTKKCANSTAEYNRNIMYKDGNRAVFQSDPCRMCIFKNKLDVRFSFDVVLRNKGTYKIAIEIVNTSPVKRDKKDYCEKNRITLIEIDWKSIIKGGQGGIFYAKEVTLN